MNEYQGGYEQAHEYGPPAQTCNLAVFSLVAGIAGYFCFGILAWIPGIILGHMALSEIGKSGGSLGGRGLAIGGLIASYIGLALSLLFLIGWVFIIFFAGMSTFESGSTAIQGARAVEAVSIDETVEPDELEAFQPFAADDKEAASISKKRIGEIRIALDAYHRDLGAFPSQKQGLRALVVNPGGSAGSSWNGPYLAEHQIDPWGNGYGYRVRGKVCEVFSLGKDGEESDDDIFDD